jgi:hypothetical protein
LAFGFSIFDFAAGDIDHQLGELGRIAWAFQAFVWHVRNMRRVLSRFQRSLNYGNSKEPTTGLLGGYTAKRRPVTLAYAQHFDLIADAIAAERQIKGWSRVKKSALISGDFAGLRAAAKRKGSF